jgi:hypothetical protein
MTPIHLNSAVYDSRGSTMQLTWERVRNFATLGFLVEFAFKEGASQFKVLDAYATSVILPFDDGLTFTDITATMYSLGQDYLRIDETKSNTVAVSAVPDSYMAPVVPMPGSPLSVGTSSITIDPQGLLSVLPQRLSWLARPEDHVSAYTDMQQVTNGKATFNVNVLRELNDAPAPLLTVSVWNPDPNGSDNDHAALLYRVVQPELVVSINRTYGVAAMQDTSPYKLDKEKNIAVTALVRDAVDQKPIRNFLLEWASHSNVSPGYVHYPDGSAPPIDPGDRRYVTYTGKDGTVTLYFGSPTPSIGEMGIYWKNKINVRQQMLAFTALGQDWVNPEMDAPDLPSTPVDLDDWHDDKGVPVVLVQDPDDYPWMKGLCFTGYLINGSMLPPELLPPDSQGEPKWIPKQYFKDGKNTLGLCIADTVGSNGHDSELSEFTVVGKVPLEQPKTSGGVFDAPFLAAGGEMVNAASIRGGLRIYIPATHLLTAGDNVTLTLYLSAFHPGTDDPKVATIHVADTRSVQPGDLVDDFYLMVSENLLANFAADLEGRPGSMQAQYLVARTGIQSYSAVAKFKLVTV